MSFLQNVKIFSRSPIIGLFLALSALAQHRGDNLAFQGISFPNENGVKALAMGGAYASLTGDINSLFWNPAGLAEVDGVQMSVSANAYQKSWRENQVYRTNRYFLTLPFYLEKLYIPNPANNGKWDHEIFISERDSSYLIRQPEMGKDVFSKEAAEWEKTADKFLLDFVAMAFRLKVRGKNLVLSAAFNRSNDVLDFDRNDTYLDPHIGYQEYGDVERVAGDTLHMTWSQFERSRFGELYSITAGAAYDLSKNIKVGIGFAKTKGETTDRQILDRVGWFDLVNSNRFRFSYDTLKTEVKGTSKFDAMNFSTGAILAFDRFSVGAKIVVPSNLKRTWKYSSMQTGKVNSAATVSGLDKMKIPATYTLGLSFKPVQSFLIAFDFESTAYRMAEFELAANDSTHRSWVDKNSIRLGIEYKPAGWLSLLAGYRNLPATFVPDGAAFRDRGPTAISYTGGISLRLGIGRIDLAYELRQLKYYDSYYSNTNYVFEEFTNLLVGYTIGL